MKVTLEQWQALLAVVDQGGYAKAADALGKSQSAVSYAIQRLEEALALSVFRIEGRRAVLTAAGELLYQRAQLLLNSAQATEEAARELAQNWQANISLAVDVCFPDETLFAALSRFGEAFPLTRVSLLETVLSGSNDALFRRQASLAICTSLPAGFNGDAIGQLTFVAVAAPSHPLHRLKRPLTLSDLRGQRQLVVRDSGRQRVDAGWLGAEQRWTLSHLATSIKAAEAGLGFAWYPEAKIQQQLASGRLKPLPLAEGDKRYASLYLVYADGDFVSPVCQQLGEMLKDACKSLAIA